MFEVAVIEESYYGSIFPERVRLPVWSIVIKYVAPDENSFTLKLQGCENVDYESWLSIASGDPGEHLLFSVDYDGINNVIDQTFLRIDDEFIKIEASQADEHGNKHFHTYKYNKAQLLPELSRVINEAIEKKILVNCVNGNEYTTFMSTNDGSIAPQIPIKFMKHVLEPDSSNNTGENCCCS